MKLIVLLGKSNEGKSETLNIVYQYLLLFGYAQVHGHYRDLGNKINKDCIDILEKKGQKVGLAMMGDYGRNANEPIDSNGEHVQDFIAYFQLHSCDVAIVACNSNLVNAVAHINSLNPVLFTKTVHSLTSMHRIVNGEDAEKIYKSI